MMVPFQARFNPILFQSSPLNQCVLLPCCFSLPVSIRSNSSVETRALQPSAHKEEHFDEARKKKRTKQADFHDCENFSYLVSTDDYGYRKKIPFSQAMMVYFKLTSIIKRNSDFAL